MSRFYADESCDGIVGSLALPYLNIGEAGTIGGVCTTYTGDTNIFYIARILSESWIDLIFIKLAEMG